jgi:acetyl-CoA acetyltransferase/uncharacterized OB-fold protein
MTDRPFRLLPRVGAENEHFWTGGRDGELRFQRCAHDRTWVHPPAPICPVCFGKDLAIEAASGRGVVHAYTINRHPWIPGFDPPYVVAIVELVEQHGLRLTTNIVGCDPAAVHVGLPVRVVFEEHEGSWLPLFEPDPAPPAPVAPQPAATGSPRRAPTSRPRTIRFPARVAAVSGIGQSDIGRRLNRDPLDLTLDACLAAIADAGLEVADIDGMATYPGGMDMPPGFSGVGITDVQEALRLDLDWFAGGMESPGQLGSVINAVAAVSSGLANHVLCFRTVWESTAQGGGGRAAVTMGGGGGGSFRAGGFMQWTLPFGAASAVNWISMMASRHFHEFGTTREQLAHIALNARRNAGLNPKAIYRDPMALDDYLSIRMISDPLCLYDCDVPVDGSTAVVISRADAAPDLRRSPLLVEGVGSAIHGRPSWDQWDDLTTMALRDAASMLWRDTDLTPVDVDVAELYDGFSFIALCWLEALGFCGKGEAGAFLADGDGANIALEGRIPLNTHGGQLSAGRLHGYGFLHEACVQLWGDGGDRQVVRSAGRQPEVAVAAAGGGPLGGCLLLTTDR